MTAILHVTCKRFIILLSTSDQDSAYEKMGNNISKSLTEYLEDESNQIKSNQIYFKLSQGYIDQFYKNIVLVLQVTNELELTR